MSLRPQILRSSFRTTHTRSPTKDLFRIPAGEDMRLFLSYIRFSPKHKTRLSTDHKPPLSFSSLIYHNIPDIQSRTVYLTLTYFQCLIRYWTSFGYPAMDQSRLHIQIDGQSGLLLLVFFFGLFF